MSEAENNSNNSISCSASPTLNLQLLWFSMVRNSDIFTRYCRLVSTSNSLRKSARCLSTPIRTSSRSLRNSQKTGRRSLATISLPTITANSCIENDSVRRTFHCISLERCSKRGFKRYQLLRPRVNVTAGKEYAQCFRISESTVSTRDESAMLKYCSSNSLGTMLC